MRGKTARGDRIRRARRARAMTQEQLAVAAGCDVKTIRNSESSRNLDVATLRKIAEALDLEFESVVSTSPDPTNVHGEFADKVRSWLAAMNTQDVAEAIECYSEDGQVVYPSGTRYPGCGTHNGHDQIRKHLVDWFGFADLELSQIGTIALQPNSNVVFLHVTTTGIIRSNSQPFRLDAIHEFQFAESGIVQHTAVFDTSKLGSSLP